MNRIQIVIPCYNEELNLDRLWNHCQSIVKQSGNQISFIVVDNGSTDDSFKFVNSHSGIDPNIRFISVKPNRGYGGGILAGLRETSAKYIGWTHADLQTPLGDCLVAKLFTDSGFEFVKGNRVGRPFFDRFFSEGMGVAMSILFQQRLREVNAQPTIIKRSFYDTWTNPPNDFSLDLYALVLAKKMSLKIKRFEVVFMKRLQGESKWNFSLLSRFKFIVRTLNYSFKLRKEIL